MFKKTRWKIVITIMTVLVLLWAGTLGIIYGSSYYEVSNRNRDMLRQHAGRYLLPHDTESGISEPFIEGGMPKPGAESGMPEPFAEPKSVPAPDPGAPHFKDTPAFQLSIFYSVAISKDGQVLTVNNSQNAVYEDEELEAIALEVAESGRTDGIKSNLIYYIADKGSYLLITFMDNTVMRESMTTLFRYTLIFGGFAILALFFLALYLAGKIIQPLEESYKKQKQFISDAGHELKTPLAVVSANAELLSREIGKNQWLSNIHYENERMGILVGQLLELARTEDVTPQMESVELCRLVKGEVLPFESVVFEKGLILGWEAPNPLYVNGNSTQLKQLTSILLDNAIRYCHPHGEITLSLKAVRSHAVLSVSNDGTEIPPAQRKQIFERFYRADTARNSEGSHYGLGLSIAKAIVSAHHGKIEVACRSGKVEFIVRIPLQKPV